MNNKFTSSIFKEGTLIDLLISGGLHIQGKIVQCLDDALIVEDAQKSQIAITPEMLSEALYLYTGFPILKDGVPVPITVGSNGTISSFNGTNGIVDYTTANGVTERKILFRNSFLENSLLKLATTTPKSLIGREVLCIIQENRNRQQQAYVLPAGSLDDTLDQIAGMVREGKKSIAIDFCHLLAAPGYYPDDKDVNEFLQALTSEVDEGIDFYSPISPKGPGRLRAKGRIFKINEEENKNYIVDVSSHEQLFFFKEQLLGDLERMTAEELIGQEVTYSVIASKNRKGYQARTIIRPMSYKEAYSLAEDLHDDYDGMELTACDLLNLIIQQHDDVDYSYTLEEWVEENERRGDTLWKTVSLPSYTGKTVSLRLSPHDSQTQVLLKRKENHLKPGPKVWADPMPPSLVFGGKKDDLQPQGNMDFTPKEEKAYKTKPVEIEQSPSNEYDRITESDIESSENADSIVQANAIISYRFGTGSLHLINDDDDHEYTFSMEDLIDEQLLDWAERTKNSTDGYISNVKVVCRTVYSENRAEGICQPATVGEMLTIANKCFLSNDFRRALYYVNNVLNFSQNNIVATRLKCHIEESIDTDKSSCYKAPTGAVVPFGEIYLAAQDYVTITDPRFIKEKKIYLAKKDIIDPGYRLQRIGDDITYAVYFRDETKTSLCARFAVLARPEYEMIKMAEDWAEDGYYENAWSIAMNILVSNPGSLPAQELRQKYEKHISKECKEGYNLPIRKNQYAFAKQKERDKDFLGAIQLYTGILESGASDSELNALCIRQILQIYHNLLTENPKDAELKKKYKSFGQKYVRDGGIAKTKKLESLRWMIQYHSDMNDTNSLIESYKRQIGVLSADKKMEALEKTNRIATARANIAWAYVRTGYELDVAQDYASQAAKEENNLAQVCLAILSLRQKKNYIDKDKYAFVSPHIDSLEQYTNLVKIYDDVKTIKNIQSERFGLLCAIMKHTGSKAELYKLLARYITTLLYNDSQYYKEIETDKSLPADCWLVQQLNKCLKKTVSWPFWSDIRLIAMLSTESAYILCNVFFDLNSAIIRQVLSKDGIDIKYNKVEKLFFAKKFNEWRGRGFQSYYKNMLDKTDALTNKKNDLEEYIDFFYNLKHETWMQTGDSDMTAALSHNMHSLLTKFKKAEDSRNLVLTYRMISDEVKARRNEIEQRPTVLTLTGFYKLLDSIKERTKKVFENKNFSEPMPTAEIVSVSAFNPDGSMIIEIEIKNPQKNAYQMADCQLKIVKQPHIEPIDSPLTYSDESAVYGGESLIYILHLRIDTDVQNARQGMLHLEFRYNKQKTLNVEELFSTVPAASVENISNTIDFGSKTKILYGREGYIDAVVKKMMAQDITPHYFIYGQKRCGKSSVLDEVERRLQDKRFICVKMEFSEFGGIENENDIYFRMQQKLYFSLKNNYNKPSKRGEEKDSLPKTILIPPVKDSVTYESFTDEYLRAVGDALSDTRGWEGYRLLFFIDEFTMAYSWLKDGIISGQFLQRWKSMQSRGLFSAVIVGQDTLDAFIKDSGVSNAFQVLNRKRLTYLEKEDARRLAVDSIINAANRSNVFIGNAVDRILYYSASSAYYTKWICYYLIEYMNANKLQYITTADVESAIRSGLKKKEEAYIFEPLTYPGQLRKESEENTEKNTIEILDKVAKAELANPQKGCYVSQIASTCFDDADLSKLLEQLSNNLDVLIEETPNYYKLKVKLYLIWTLERTSGNA